MGFGVAVADGLEVGFAVGAAVGLAVGFAVAAGFGVAVAEGFEVAALLLSGFAVALGLLTVLLSGSDAADELLSFELSVLMLSVLVSGTAVGFAFAVLELAAGLLLVSDALLSSFFSGAALLTVPETELSDAAFSVVLLPAHAASESVSAAAIKIAVIFFFIQDQLLDFDYMVCLK